MTWSEVFVYITIVLGLALWWVWVAASRLDRLHRKVSSSRAVVDAQLVRRATVAAELRHVRPARPGQLGARRRGRVGGAARPVARTWPRSAHSPRTCVSCWPRTAVRCPCRARTTRTSGPAASIADRSRASCPRRLREVLDDPDEVAALRSDPTGNELVDALASAWYRVQLARRFHNEAVAQTTNVRRGPLVRLFRLAGHAPAPHSLELDDTWPENLGRPGARPAAVPEAGPTT